MTGKRAGESAADVARRHREKIERLERSAAAWEAGAAGEQVTGEVLARLDPNTWTVWHDVRWPGRQWANLDHVVVGPPGVFVIDTKNWSGRVTVSDGVLRQNGRARDTTVAGAVKAAHAVRMLGVEAPVHAVLCLVRDESVSGTVGDVIVCSTHNLEVMAQTRPQVLTPEEVAAAVNWLGAGFEARPLFQPEPPRPARSEKSRRRLSVLRPLLGVAVMMLVAGSVQTGHFFAGLQWMGDRVGDVVVEPPATDTLDDEPDTEPLKKAKKKNAKRPRGSGSP